MNYRLLLHKSVTKFIEKCSKKHRQDIKQKLELLKQNPYNHIQLDIKDIQGHKNLYRLRTGQYRFIYQINDNELHGVRACSCGYDCRILFILEKHPKTGKEGWRLRALLAGQSV